MKDLWYKTNVDWKDIAVRASKTFLQAFVAVVLVAGQPLSKELVVAGLAAGVSAVWNSGKSIIGK